MLKIIAYIELYAIEENIYFKLFWSFRFEVKYYERQIKNKLHLNLQKETKIRKITWYLSSVAPKQWQQWEKRRKEKHKLNPHKGIPPLTVSLVDRRCCFIWGSPLPRSRFLDISSSTFHKATKGGFYSYLIFVLGRIIN